MPPPALIGEDVDFLSLLTEAKQRELLEHSTRVTFAAGTVAYRPEDPPIVFLVERGLIRIYRTVPDGRQASVAFIHTKELLGGARIVGKPVPSVFVQVVVDSTLTLLEVDTVRRLAATDIEVMAGIARHLAAQLGNAFRMISVRSVGDIRERLAYDLLERACHCQLAAGRLEVPVTHAELADSIGSSREVVSRALKGFRAVGIIDTAPRVIRVADAQRLADIVRAFAI